jgi:hypothetical protein
MGRTNSVIYLASVCALSLGPNASAELIEHTFAGEVYFTEGVLPDLWQDVEIGDAWEFTYIFDSETPDQFPSVDTIGIYEVLSSELTFNDQSMMLDFAEIDIDLSLGVHSIQFTDDLDFISGVIHLFPPPGEGDSLPATFSLDDFISTPVLELGGGTQSGPFSAFGNTLTFTSQVIPAPAVFATLLLGVGLHRARRRRRVPHAFGLAAVPLLVLLSTTTSAQAELIEHTFAGEVDFLNGTLPTPWQDVELGDTWEFTYIFDSETPDQFPTVDTLGVYEVISAELTFNGLSIQPLSTEISVDLMVGVHTVSFDFVDVDNGAINLIPPPGEGDNLPITFNIDDLLVQPQLAYLGTTRGDEIFQLYGDVDTFTSQVIPAPAVFAMLLTSAGIRRTPRRRSPQSHVHPSAEP